MSEPTQIYLISPSEFSLADFSTSLEGALSAGPVASFQLRMKDADDDAIRQAVNTLMPICHKHDVAFILNPKKPLKPD